MKRKMEKDRLHLMEMMEQHEKTRMETERLKAAAAGFNQNRESNERREEFAEESTELANTTDIAIDDIELSQLIGEDFNTVKKKRHGWHNREGRILTQDQRRQDSHRNNSGHSRQDEEIDLSLAPSSRSLEWWRRLSS